MKICTFSLFAISQNSANVSECICIASFVWRNSDSKCVKDCSKSADPNAVAVATDNVSCICEPGYYWRTDKICARKCTKAADMYVLGPDRDDPNVCLCDVPDLAVLHKC